MKRRTKIIFVLFILFFLITPTTIFYIQGYRINFNLSNGAKIITKTGGFYFNIVTPKNVEIYINNRLKSKTNFFSNNIFLKNYLPKKYKIEIKKKGFHTWMKNLEVKEKYVTEIKNVVLIPENPNFLFLMKNIENYFFSPNKEKIIIKENLKNNWKLYLYNINDNTKNDLINEKDISKENINLIDLKFSNDSKKILIKTKINKKNKYYFFLIDLEKNSNAISLIYESNSNNDDEQEIFFNPENSQKLFILEKNNLFEKDLKRKTKIKLLEKIVTFLSSDKDIYYIDDSGFVFKTNFSFQNKEKINEIPFLLQDKQKYKINIFLEEIFIQDKNNLYLFNTNTKTFEKFFENYKEIKISPDFKKLAYFSDYEIWIMYLTTIQDQPPKIKGEKTFITRVSKKIGDVFWLNSHYLIYNSEDEIKIAEIDDRDKINIVDLIKYKSPKIYWAGIYKKLFLLSENNLYSLKILVR